MSLFQHWRDILLRVDMSLKQNLTRWTSYHVSEDVMLSYEGFYEQRLCYLIPMNGKIGTKHSLKKQVPTIMPLPSDPFLAPGFVRNAVVV